jgi:hypothetical protein
MNVVEEHDDYFV